MRARQVLERRRTPRRAPSCSNSAGVAAERFRMAPSGASEPKQRDETALRLERVVERPDRRAVDRVAGVRGQALAAASRR